MVEAYQQPNATVIALDEDYDSLDDRAIQQLRTVLLEEALRAEPPLLVVDFSKTTFFGSSFIEVLFQAHKRIREREGKLVLAALSPNCAEVLKATRLDSLWDIYPTRDAALQAFSANDAK
jgi:anti-anti-sigma factor